MAVQSRSPVLETRSDGGNADTTLVPVFEDSGKKAIPPKGAYSGLVERLRKGDTFSGKGGTVQFLRFGGKGPSDNVAFVGFGHAPNLTDEKARSFGGSAWTKLVSEKCRTVAVDVDALLDAKGLKAEPARIVRAFAEGLGLGAYRFTRFKSARADDPFGPLRLVFFSRDRARRTRLEASLATVVAELRAIEITRDWSNLPSNVGTPEHFARGARRLARDYGLRCRILGAAEARREQMRLFLAVGRGSVREGKIVVLEYAPKGVRKAQKAKTIALVGKGVTFDSGGISIKPALRMEDMKHDMTGAATVMGTMLLASAWKVPNRLVAVLAFTENMPDGDAVQPGNVIVSRSGKTVEIVNTDAEGRLILADALDFAQGYRPDAVIDVATLTGAVSIALGKICGGILGNDDALVDAVRRSADSHGERLWQLPLFDEYFDDMKSDVADMKNTANDGYGGTIRGAIFLKQFIRKGIPWAHLDIAATAYNVSHLSYLPKKGASGAFVRTLAQFAADY